jgi:hypothetical protein
MSMSRFKLSQTIVGLTIVLLLEGGCGLSPGLSLLEAPAASPIPKPPPTAPLSVTSAPPTIDLRWNTSPAARIIRYYSPDTSAGMAGAYNHAYYLPEVQVWGDGRMIWVTYEGSERRLREGRLTPEQMKALLVGSGDDA